ncbi:PEP-CTERM sorting domain-containing protein [Oxalobacteraceae bacterium]|nr:PEP-CTERM sorting domain-containing protein [Oxalobacteraceae bacterium]
MKNILIGMVVAASTAIASAQVVTVADRALFNASGNIAYNTNFDSFGDYFNYPGDPYTSGDVTYTSQQNLTVGLGTGYSVGDFFTVMTNNWWTPLTASVASNMHYNLLGFDAAVTSGPVAITISTNQNTYHYFRPFMPNGSPDFAFEGFRAAGGGEYFTGFSIASQGPGFLPGITHVAVGVSPVAEPETIGMLLAGLAWTGVIARRKKTAVRV